MFTADQIRAMIASGDVHAFYNDRFWRRLSHRIIKAHHGECQLCKAEHRLTRATVVHHVKHLRRHPELAYDTDNLIPLCHDCHERIHERGAYARTGGFTNEEKW